MKTIDEVRSRVLDLIDKEKDDNRMPLMKQAGIAEMMWFETRQLIIDRIKKQLKDDLMIIWEEPKGNG